MNPACLAGSERLKCVGIIESLSAGYRYLGWRLYLLLIPLALDLVLWLAPQVSVAPLLQAVGQFYANMTAVDGMPPDMIEWSRQLADGLMTAGDQSNLLGLLINSSLLQVPSGLVAFGPGSSIAIWTIADPIVALGLALVFSLLGLLIGVFYIGLLAQQLPIGAAPKVPTLIPFVRLSLRQWFKLILFVVLVVVGLIAIYIPVSLSATLILFFSPALGVFVMLLLSGLSFVLFFYLYFVPAGLIMDNVGLRTAITQSFRLVRTNFWSTLGFFLLTSVISAGCSLLLDRLAFYQPLGTLAAMVANAYIGTGLALALLIFYRTQLLRATGDLSLGGQL